MTDNSVNKSSDNTLDSLPWVEKYRPKTLDGVVQDENLIKLFRKSIETQNISHFLFYGSSGSGKTSVALAIGREIFKEFFPSRVIEFNASDDRGINAVREKITLEAKKYVTDCISADGSKIPPYKIIILDEADSMTDEAQDALRVIIEEYSSVTRFCFICNYISKITDAIKSRCSAVYFKKLSVECMINKLNEIAEKEDMKLEKNILNTIIEVSNGDMRKAIMILQNLKYLYDFKNLPEKKLKNLTIKELKTISILNSNIDLNSNLDPKEKEIDTAPLIVEQDIYEISASIDLNLANRIINDTLLCKNIVEVSNLSKNIISMGYPIDNVLAQLNKAVLESKKLKDIEKAKIISYSGRIFLKMKECSSEYIQLLDYLSSINGIKKGNSIY